MKLFLKIKSIFWPTKENKNQPLILTDRAISLLILFFLLVKVFFSFEILIVRQSSLFAEVSAQKILELTNDLRKQYGLPPLKENPLLKEAAQKKALDMIQNKYFAHYSPTGLSPWYFIEKSGYNYHYAGENLAMNFLDSEEVVRAWVNSPTHRDNLLNQKYEEIGIAVISGDITGDNLSKIIVVQMFGSQINKPTGLTKVAQAKEALPTTTPQEVITTTTKKFTSSTTKPIPSETSISKPTSSEIARIEDEELKETTTTLATTTFSETTTTAAVVSQSQENIEKLMEKQTKREKITTFNQIIAFTLITLGTIVLIGIINQRQESTYLVYSELIIRGALVILIGFAFLLFKMEVLIGHLAIA